jgi:hypothetical protein
MVGSAHIDKIRPTDFLQLRRRNADIDTLLAN